MNKILNTRQVAVMLGVSYMTVMKYIYAKQLKAHKLGGNGSNKRHWRIREHDLELFISGERKC